MTSSQPKRTAGGKVAKLVRIAVLTAMILILNFTPLGYLRFGPVEITFMQIPVVIGAVMIGPGAGAILGLVFGLTSLSKAPVDPVFSPVFATYPVLVAVVCIVPRILMGFLSGLLFSALRKAKVKTFITYAVTGFCGSLFNTVLFIGGVILVLGSYIQGTMTELGLLAEKTLVAFWMGVAITNGLPEAIATAIIVSAVCKALAVIEDRKNK